MSEEELKDDFYGSVIIDCGYVSLANWELSNVDTDNQEIMFTKVSE